jgi:hypothetical protein
VPLTVPKSNSKSTNFVDWFGFVVKILVYYARGRGFDPRIVQTFVYINKSAGISQHNEKHVVPIPLSGISIKECKKMISVV